MTGANGEKRMMKIAEAAAAGEKGQGHQAQAARCVQRACHGDATAADSASVVTATNWSDAIAVRAT
jgi:hypothetical protein